MEETAGARTLPVEQGWGRCTGNLVAAMEMLSEAADGLVASYPGLDIRENGLSMLFLPMFFKVFLILAFETKI